MSPFKEVQPFLSRCIPFYLPILLGTLQPDLNHSSVTYQNVCRYLCLQIFIHTYIYTNTQILTQECVRNESKKMIPSLTDLRYRMVSVPCVDLKSLVRDDFPRPRVISNSIRVPTTLLHLPLEPCKTTWSFFLREFLTAHVSW